jgi:hypothetical protein
LLRRRGKGDPLLVLAADPSVLAGGTLALMVLQYSPFSHTLRHLVPMWPVVAWCLIHEGAIALDRWRRPGSGARTALLTAATGLCLVLTPTSLPGWERAVRGASRQNPLVDAALLRIKSFPPGAIFTDNAAVIWYSQRVGVWSPHDEEIEAELRRRIPDLADARRLTLTPSDIPMKAAGEH